MGAKNLAKMSDIAVGGSDYSKKIKKEQRQKRGRARTGSLLSDLQFGLVAGCMLFAMGVGADFGLGQMGYSSKLVAAKHLAAGVDCHVAVWLQMAPAGMEEPGYWMHLDADKDGTSCEE